MKPKWSNVTSPALLNQPMAREKARAELPGREWVDVMMNGIELARKSQSEWSAAMEQLYHSDGFSVGKLIRPKRD